MFRYFDFCSAVQSKVRVMWDNILDPKSFNCLFVQYCQELYFSYRFASLEKEFFGRIDFNFHRAQKRKTFEHLKEPFLSVGFFKFKFIGSFMIGGVRKDYIVSRKFFHFWNLDTFRVNQFGAQQTPISSE